MKRKKKCNQGIQADESDEPQSNSQIHCIRYAA